MAKRGRPRKKPKVTTGGKTLEKAKKDPRFKDYVQYLGDLEKKDATAVLGIDDKNFVYRFCLETKDAEWERRGCADFDTKDLKFLNPAGAKYWPAEDHQSGLANRGLKLKRIPRDRLCPRSKPAAQQRQRDWYSIPPMFFSIRPSSNS